MDILLSVLGTKLFNALNHPQIHFLGHSREHPNPETICHYKVGVLQFTNNAIAFTRLTHLIEARMFGQITCKEVTGLNFVLLQITS